MPLVNLITPTVRAAPLPPPVNILISENFETGTYINDSTNPSVSGSYFYERDNQTPGGPGALARRQMITNSPDAQDPATGQQYSLRVGYINQSFSQNSFILRFGSVPQQNNEYYIRFRQKWGTDFEFPADQQKYMKIQTDDDLWGGSFRIEGALTSENDLVDGFVPGPQRDQGTMIAFAGNPSPTGAGQWTYQKRKDEFLRANRINDSINNGLGPGGADAQFYFVRDQWYWIEIRHKLNTIGQADGITEIWVDGVLIHQQTDSQMRTTSGVVEDLELQHIYQDYFIGITNNRVVVTSVTDSGGTARFNFTPGPTVNVGDVLVTGEFEGTGNEAYNNGGTVTAAGVGYFEIGVIGYNANDSGGYFASQVSSQITSVTDSSGTARFNYTPGPRKRDVQVGDLIGIDDMTNEDYNRSGVVTAVGTGYFEISTISYGGASSGGYYAHPMYSYLSNITLADGYMGPG